MSCFLRFLPPAIEENLIRVSVASRRAPVGDNAILRAPNRKRVADLEMSGVEAEDIWALGASDDRAIAKGRLDRGLRMFDDCLWIRASSSVTPSATRRAIPAGPES